VEGEKFKKSRRGRGIPPGDGGGKTKGGGMKLDSHTKEKIGVPKRRQESKSDPLFNLGNGGRKGSRPKILERKCKKEKRREEKMNESHS